MSDPVTEKRRLEIYDILRTAHQAIKDIYLRGNLNYLADFDRTTVDGVDAVLYMAEAIFARNDGGTR